MKCKAITNWVSENKSEQKILLWFFSDRKLDFKFFDNKEEVKTFCKNYKIKGYTKALKAV